MDSTSAQLKADLERATAEYEPVRQQYEEAEHSYEKTYKEYFAAILDEGARQRWNYWSDQKMKVLKEELDKRSKKDEAERKVAAFPTAQFFFEGLPDGIAKARTNSNGEFSMTLPRKGRFALAARAHRETPDEKYYWLVWVSLNGEATKTVLLSNHNVMTAQSPDVVVRAKGMTL